MSFFDTRNQMGNTLENASINWKNVVKVGGVFASWCIGSGFVTGQECLQYFVGYGKMGYAAIAEAMILHVILLISFFTLGFKLRNANPMQIFEYYAGKKLAKVFQVMCLALSATCPIVMISGFGAAANQYFGIPNAIGNVLLAILCAVTVILGLHKMVDICGAIGPVIVVFAIGIGAYYLTGHLDSVKAGIELAPTLPLSKIAPVWWMSAYYYVCPLHSAPYMAATATTCNSKREAIYGGIFGVIIYAAAVLTMVTATFSNVVELSESMIPNLYIANQLSPVLGLIFVILIFLGIYSSTAPCFFNVCRTFAEEKTKRYNTIAVVYIAVGTLISLLFPFDKLFSAIYGTFGAVGGVLILCVFGRFIYDYVQSKKAPASAE